MSTTFPLLFRTQITVSHVNSSLFFALLISLSLLSFIHSCRSFLWSSSLLSSYKAPFPLPLIWRRWPTMLFHSSVRSHTGKSLSLLHSFTQEEQRESQTANNISTSGRSVTVARRSSARIIGLWRWWRVCSCRWLFTHLTFAVHCSFPQQIKRRFIDWIGSWDREMRESRIEFSFFTIFWYPLQDSVSRIRRFPWQRHAFFLFLFSDSFSFFFPVLPLREEMEVCGTDFWLDSWLLLQFLHTKAASLKIAINCA